MGKDSKIIVIAQTLPTNFSICGKFPNESTYLMAIKCWWSTSNIYWNWVKTISVIYLTAYLLMYINLY